MIGHFAMKSSSDELPEPNDRAATLLETAPPPQLEIEPAIDADEIVEAAEELLRENAPHDFEVLVIGGGPGGSVCAMRAAQLGLKTALIEVRELGGVCLNRGCIPTKTLLESVEVMRLLRRAREYGISQSGEIAPDFAAMNARRDAVIRDLRAHVSRLLDENGVQVLEGHARFVGEHVVEIATPNGEIRRLTAVNVVIASGSLPLRLPVPGADLEGVLTSDELFQETQVPQVLVTVGAGAVGVEFAYLFHELGAESVLLEAKAQVMPGEDAKIGQEMERLLREYGMQVETQAKLLRIERDESRRETPLRVWYEQNGRENEIWCDRVLMAAGRRANTENLDLAAAGVVHEKGRIEVDEQCQTNIGGVYAIGDCIRNVGWAHGASGEGTLVAEIMAGREPSVDLHHLPSCYYTHPEVASVGLTQEKARALGKSVRCGVFEFRSNGRAAAAGEHDGWVQIVVENGSELIIGCQIIGPRATELINEAVVALKNRSTLEEFIGAVHAHPTFAEALPEAALNARRKGLEGNENEAGANL